MGVWSSDVCSSDLGAVSAVNFELPAGGVLDGPGTLTTTGAFRWTGGAMYDTSTGLVTLGTGATTIAAGGTLTIEGAVGLGNRTLTNAGTAVWTGSGDIAPALD